MVLCNNYVSAEDGNGNVLPMLVRFYVYYQRDSSWVKLGLLSIQPGIPTKIALTQGTRHLFVPIVEDGYEVPAEVEITACSGDVTFIYKKIVEPEPDPEPEPTPDPNATCFYARDNRNGVSYTINRMMGGNLVPWIKIRPTRMERTHPIDPITVTFNVSEYISGSWIEIYRGSQHEGMIIDVSTSDTDIGIVFFNGDMNNGTESIRCCYIPGAKCNLNISIYDETKQGVENAVFTYNGETKKTNDNGFVSFLEPCYMVSDLAMSLPLGYNISGESSWVFKDIPVDTDDDPTTPHVKYIEVNHSPAVPEGLNLTLPTFVMVGSEFDITGTCNVMGLTVEIYAIRKWFGFDYLASDTLIATTIVDSNYQFTAPVTFDEFGVIELYAKVTDDLKTPKKSLWILTWTVVIAILLAVGLILEKKYNKLGLFKKR